MTDNLAPGTAAPHSGTYVCGFCGPGGLAESVTGPMVNLRSGESGMRNEHYTTPISRRLTVYTMTAGERLPECPNCGTATGWDPLTGTLEDMLETRVAQREAVFDNLGITRAEPPDPHETELDRLTVLTDESRGSTPCDVCNQPVRAGAGFLLSTPQVLTSEAYWCHLIRMAARGLEAMPDHAARERYFAELVRGRERDRTPWLICDACTEMFVADWHTAREYVLRGTRPPRPGRLRNRFGLGDYVLPAARAWTRERGSWPASVAPAGDADDQCDLCAKPVWPKETVTFVKPDVVAGWVRAGVLTTDTATPPRETHGQPGWLACLPCTARVFARLYRQKES